MSKNYGQHSSRIDMTMIKLGKQLTSKSNVSAPHDQPNWLAGNGLKLSDINKHPIKGH